MTILKDSLPSGRFTGPPAPRRRVAAACKPELDVNRRVPADISRAIHQFMQIDELAFHRALSNVNQGKHLARHAH